jgi:hypothetical protein
LTYVINYIAEGGGGRASRVAFRKYVRPVEFVSRVALLSYWRPAKIKKTMSSHVAVMDWEIVVGIEGDIAQNK